MFRFILPGLALLCALPAIAQTSWTPRHQGGASAEFLWGVTDGRAGAVAVGTHGRIMHSMDGGATWHVRPSPTSEWLVAVTFGGDRYVAVGDRGMILVSSDALQWSSVSSGTSARINNVAYGRGRYVAVGEGGTILVSTDAVRWTRETISFNGWLRGLAIAEAGLRWAWLATGEGGAAFASLDNSSWLPVANASHDDLEAAAPVEAYTGLVAFNLNAWFHVVGANGISSLAHVGTGGHFVTTPTYLDPQTGRSVSGLGTTARLRSITRGNALTIVTGENGFVATAPSAAGPWTRAATGTTMNLVAAGYVNGTLVLVGENETILQSPRVATSRLVNLSTRGEIGPGATTLTAGAVIRTASPKTVLVRAVGPTLAGFGVGSPLPDPVLRVFDANGRLLATNNGWRQNRTEFGIATVQVGAFPLRNDNDAGVLLSLPQSGAFTFEVSSASGARGTALIEVYDADAQNAFAADTDRAVNMATRGNVNGDGSVLLAGLVVSGPASRTFLLRGIGPSLASFGVTGAVADPAIRLLTSSGFVIASNNDWADATPVNGRVVVAEEIAAAAQVSGAFPLPANSKDAALLVTLVPGSYTVLLSGANNTAGTALVEAYEVPTN